LTTLGLWQQGVDLLDDRIALDPEPNSAESTPRASIAVSTLRPSP
jgi:hypothetical protein